MEGNYGADQVIIVHSCQKPLLGWLTASKTADKPHIIGVTSSGNTAFVEALGHYDQVVTYDDLAAIKTIRASLSICQAIAATAACTFGDAMLQCVNVGLTLLGPVGNNGCGQNHHRAVKFFFAHRMPHIAQ